MYDRERNAKRPRALSFGKSYGGDIQADRLTFFLTGCTLKRASTNSIHSSATGTAFREGKNAERRENGERIRWCDVIATTEISTNNMQTVTIITALERL